jgi:hypothetical protein
MRLVVDGRRQGASAGEHVGELEVLLGGSRVRELRRKEAGGNLEADVNECMLMANWTTIERDQMRRVDVMYLVEVMLHFESALTLSYSTGTSDNENQGSGRMRACGAPCCTCPPRIECFSAPRGTISASLRRISIAPE